MKYWPVALVYLVVGFLAYARILNTFFVADDFSYLDDIERANSATVIFSPLAERYFRPMVVLVYYLNYKLSGLSAWTYHLSVVLIHVANAWLVFQVGRAVAPDRVPVVAALAGLLFVVFGGHAEAVTWIGGMADPLVTLFLLSAVLFFHRSLDAVDPLPSLVGMWIAFALALLTKELAAVLLGFAVVFLAMGRSALPDARQIRRAAIAIAGAIVLLAAYFLLRRSVLGFTFVNLEGLGTSSNLLVTLRAFVLRSFLPYSGVLIRIWNSWFDVYVILPMVLVLLFFVRRENWRPLLLLAACFGFALAPVLPLSIGIASPESERLVYLATAFSCLLLVWFVDAICKRWWLLVPLIVVWSALHGYALDRINRRWVVAAHLVQGITSSFRALMGEHLRPGWPVYVLNVPDEVGGAYIYRRGFHESLRVTGPDQIARIARIDVLSVYAVLDATTPATVTRVNPLTFAIDFGGGSLIGTSAQSGPLSTIADVRPEGFKATFTDSAGPGLVVYFSPERAVLAGVLSDGRRPFGVVDLPSQDVDCRGQAIEFAGWTLDHRGVSRVSVSVESNGAGAVEIGEAERYARPDVERAYPGFVDSAMAGWRYALACESVRPDGGGQTARIIIDVENRSGARAVIGTRQLRFTR